MTTTRLSSKGQIIIPKHVRDRHNWREGQEFDVVESAEGVVLRPHPAFPPSRVEDIGSSLKYGGKKVPIEQLSVEGMEYRDPYQEEGE